MTTYSGFVYRWINNVTGVKYIGSHKGSIDDGYVGSGLAFRSALAKYGIDNFDREILELVQDPSEIKAREQYYLDLFECATSNDYYNLSLSASGGNMGQDYTQTSKKAVATSRARGHFEKNSERMKKNNPNFGGHARREYVKNFGSPNTGWRATEDTKEKLREQKLGERNPRYGKPGTMRTKTFLVDVATGEVKEFPSLGEAEKFIGANHASVWYNRKRGRPHKGYHWCVGTTELTNLMSKK